MSFYLDDDDDDDFGGNGRGNLLSHGSQSVTRITSTAQRQQVSSLSSPSPIRPNHASQTYHHDDVDPGTDHGGGSFVCDNCGGSDSYVDDVTGVLTCSNCFTQSQSMLAASQEEFDYDEAVGMANKQRNGQLLRTHYGQPAGDGRKKRGGRPLIPMSERDKSVPPPHLNDCLMGLQTVLQRACRILCCELMVADPSIVLACTDDDAAGGVGTPVDHASSSNPPGGNEDPPSRTGRRSGRQLYNEASKTVKTLWKSYLEAWMEGAEYYGAIYPEFRFSFRDYFLKKPVRYILYQTLAARAAKELKERVENESDGDDDEEDESDDESEDDKQSRESEKPPPEVIYSDRKRPRKDAVDDVDGDDNDGSDGDQNKNYGDRDHGMFVANDSDSSVSSELSVFNTQLGTSSKSHDSLPAIAKLLFLHQKRLRQQSKAKRMKKWSVYRMGRMEAALLLSPSMTMATGMLWMAVAPYGVTANKMIHWVGTGALPLLNAFKTLLPEEQQTKLTEVSGFFREPVPPTAAQLTRVVKCLHLASRYEPPRILVRKKKKLNSRKSSTWEPVYAPGRVIRPSTVPIILAGLVSDLGLSQKILNYSLAMMGLAVAKETLIVKEPLKKPVATTGDAPTDQPVPVTANRASKYYSLPPQLSAARPHKLTEVSKILAVMVVACKLIPNWENHGYKLSIPAPKSEGEASNEGRSETKRVKAGRRFIPWDEQHFRLLGNGRLESDYLDYIEENIINIKSPVLPRFVSMLKIPEASTGSSNKDDVVEDNNSTDPGYINETISNNSDGGDGKGDDERPIVTPNVHYVTFNTKHEPASKKRRRNGSKTADFEYVLTRPCDLKNTRTLDPPLGSLIEYMAYKSGTLPEHILAYLVKLEKEIGAKGAPSET